MRHLPCVCRTHPARLVPTALRGGGRDARRGHRHTASDKPTQLSASTCRRHHGSHCPHSARAMVTTHAPAVVVGSGHAGIQVASSLRKYGYIGPIVVIGDEDRQPYHRPPLSKTFVTAAEPKLELLCGPNFCAS